MHKKWSTQLGELNYSSFKKRPGERTFQSRKHFRRKELATYVLWLTPVQFSARVHMLVRQNSFQVFLYEKVLVKVLTHLSNLLHQKKVKSKIHKYEIFSKQSCVFLRSQDIKECKTWDFLEVNLQLPRVHQNTCRNVI